MDESGKKGGEMTLKSEQGEVRTKPAPKKSQSALSELQHDDDSDRLQIVSKYLVLL